MLYSFLNTFFFFFHTSLILFNMVGWIFPKTRKLNLLTLLLTAFSWFVLGAWFGWGYCFCTDWHWQVREHLGVHDQTNSYNHFLILKLTGLNLNLKLVDAATAVIFFASLLMSGWFNARDYRNKRPFTS